MVDVVRYPEGETQEIPTFHLPSIILMVIYKVEAATQKPDHFRDKP